MSQILKLEPFYFVLWATPKGERVPFEVSKEVTQPLQPLCATSPYCPDERIPRIRGEREGEGPPTSVVQYVQNPAFEGVGECPYDFTTKEACYRDLNQALLRHALFDAQQSRWFANFLDSMGYHVTSERIGESDIAGGRTLQAHGMTYHFHEIRFEIGPGNVGLVMIRNPYDPDPRATSDQPSS